jgi:hypothetical protein
MLPRVHMCNKHVDVQAFKIGFVMLVILARNQNTKVEVVRVVHIRTLFAPLVLILLTVLPKSIASQVITLTPTILATHVNQDTGVTILLEMSVFAQHQ